MTTPETRIDCPLCDRDELEIALGRAAELSDDHCRQICDLDEQLGAALARVAELEPLVELLDDARACMEAGCTPALLYGDGERARVYARIRAVLKEQVDVLRAAGMGEETWDG